MFTQCPFLWAQERYPHIQFLGERNGPAHPAIAPPLRGSREGADLTHRDSAIRRLARSDNDSYSLVSFNWGDNLSPRLSQCAKAYLDGAVVDCTVDSICTIAMDVDQLNCLCGEVRVSARNTQWGNLPNRGISTDGLPNVTRAGQSLVNRVVDYRSSGFIPVYRGTTHAAPRDRGIPYQKRQSLCNIAKLRRGVRDGRILICSANTVSEFDTIGRTPPTIATKKSPRVAFLIAMRLISDVRLINNFCDKADFPVGENHALADIA